MAKNIDTEPIKISLYLKGFLKAIKGYSLLGGCVSLFLWGYFMTFEIFSNDYILKIFIKNNGYSRKCLNLFEKKDESLVFDIHELFQSLNQNNRIAPIFFNNVPKTLPNITNMEVRKSVFINILLPIIIKVQNEVDTERQKVSYINTKILKEPLSDEDFKLIRDLAAKYNVKMQDDNFWDYTKALEDLTIRVDIIPFSLVLAVAAKETGWGSSRFLIEGNSLFAEWVWSESLGIIPTERAAGAKHAVRSFQNLEDSVISYYRNLNTHNAYQGFRLRRYKMRIKKEVMDPVILANQLSKYSTETQDYVRNLALIIRGNKLTVYDKEISLSDDYNSICINMG
ncbi:putative Bax domain-containing glucosaminidase [Candidatus Hepatincolaceae symbiont of Richtersius coronifer]